MATATINLEDYRTPGSQVFTGRDRGGNVRVRSKIDELYKLSDKVIIEIPADIFSINPSFLEELFTNVVRDIGKVAFLKKFEFVNRGEYKINENLDAAIDRILRKSNSLTA